MSMSMRSFSDYKKLETNIAVHANTSSPSAPKARLNPAQAAQRELILKALEQRRMNPPKVSKSGAVRVDRIKFA